MVVVEWLSCLNHSPWPRPPRVGVEGGVKSSALMVLLQIGKLSNVDDEGDSAERKRFVAAGLCPFLFYGEQGQP